MPFTKGHAKTGGRKKGIPLEVIRRDVADKLSQLGFDPIAKLVELAEDPECTPDRRARICDNLSRFLHPIRKAVELTGAGGGPVELNVSGLELFKSRIDRIAQRNRPRTNIPGAD